MEDRNMEVFRKTGRLKRVNRLICALVNLAFLFNPGFCNRTQV